MPISFERKRDRIDTIYAADFNAIQIGVEENRALIEAHLQNQANPHNVTKEDIGLGNVDNTSDMNKPISTVVQAALNGKVNLAVFDAAMDTNLNDHADFISQLNQKAGINHTHVIDHVTGLQAALDEKAGAVHTHVIADISGLQAALDDVATGEHNHDDRYYTESEVDNAIALAVGFQEGSIIDGGYLNGGVDHPFYINSPIITDSAGTPQWQGNTGLEISHINGLQAALNDAGSSVHTHPISDVVGLQAALDGKAGTSHTHAASAIVSGVLATGRLGTGTADANKYLRGDGTWADMPSGTAPHVHPINDITGLQTALDSKVTEAQITNKNGLVDQVLIDATDTPSINYSILTVLGAEVRAMSVNQSWLHGQLNDRILAGTHVTKTYNETEGTITLGVSSHTHTIANITGLQSALDGKAASSHTHSIANVTGLQAALDDKAASDHAHAGTGDGTVMLGQLTDASAPFSVALGYGAKANAGWNATAVGNSAEATGSNNSTAIGTLSKSEGLSSLAVGHFAHAETDYDTALGMQAHASGNRSIALGVAASASGLRSIAIGRNAAVTSADTAQIMANRLELARSDETVGNTVLALMSPDGTYKELTIGNDASLRINGSLPSVSSHTHHVNDLTATGTKSSSTYLRGDNTWATPPNTTYSVMSQAEAEAGTATSARTMSAARLKATILYYAGSSAHTHVMADITDLQAALDNKANAADLSAMSMSNVLAHNGFNDRITDLEDTVDDLASGGSPHSHSNLTILNNTTASFTTALQSKLAGIASGAEVNVNADWNAASGDAQILNKPSTFTPSAHSHAIADVTGLQSALDGKASSSHSHSIANVTGLQTALDAKLNLSGGTLTGGLSVNGSTILNGGILNGNTQGGTELWINSPEITDVFGPPVWSGDTGLGVANINGLQSALDGKASSSHTHAAADIQSGVLSPNRLGTGTANSGKYLRGDGVWTDMPSGTSPHVHPISDVTGLQDALDDKVENNLAYTIFHSTVLSHAEITSGNPHGTTAAMVGAAEASHVHGVGDITASGTAGSTTYLRGDGSWVTPPNTTYTAMSQAEMQTGTATTSRALTAARLKEAVIYHAPVQTGHTHAIGDITGLQTALDGKAASGHSHVAGDVTSGVFAPARLGSGTANSGKYLRGDGTWADMPTGTAPHTHTIGDITGLQTALDGKAASSHTHGVGDITATGTAGSNTYLRGDGTWATPTNTTYSVMSSAEMQTGTASTARTLSAARLKEAIAYHPPASHTHTIANVTGLQAALDGKAASSHTHTIANVTGLQTALDGKAAIGHFHEGTGENSILLGDELSVASSPWATAVGPSAEASTGWNNTAVGNSAKATLEDNATAVGSLATASALSATAIGYFAQATDDYGTAVGPTAQASGDRSLALGVFARAEALRSIAIGRNAQVTTADTAQIMANILEVKRSDETTGDSKLQLMSPDGTNKQLGINNDNSLTVGGSAIPVPSHTHDDRYYTETEVNTALSGKANTSHTHVIADTTGLQAALDGKAASSHNHAASNITSGTLADARIPNLNASKTTAGTFAQARLGTGTANAAAVLRGNGAWTAETHIFTEVLGEYSAVAVGDYVDFMMPWNVYVDKITLLGNDDGNFAVQLFKTTFTDWPTETRIDSSSAASYISFPSLNRKSENTTLSSWSTRTFSAQDILRFRASTVSGSTRVIIALHVTRQP